MLVYTIAHKSWVLRILSASRLYSDGDFNESYLTNFRKQFKIVFLFEKQSHLQ